MKVQGTIFRKEAGQTRRRRAIDELRDGLGIERSRISIDARPDWPNISDHHANQQRQRGNDFQKKWNGPSAPSLRPHASPRSMTTVAKMTGEATIIAKVAKRLERYCEHGIGKTDDCPATPMSTCTWRLRKTRPDYSTGHSSSAIGFN
jgi:hypothetical protein